MLKALSTGESMKMSSDSFEKGFVRKMLEMATASGMFTCGLAIPRPEGTRKFRS